MPSFRSARRDVLAVPRWRTLATLIAATGLLGTSVLWAEDAARTGEPTVAKVDASVYAAAESAMRGDLDAALDTLDAVNVEALAGQPAQLKAWITQFKEVQTQRAALHKQERDRAIADAKESMAEEDYRKALFDIRLVEQLEDAGPSILNEPWVEDIIAAAERSSAEKAEAGEWLEARAIEGQLAALFEDDEARQKKHEANYERFSKHARVAELYKAENLNEVMDTMLRDIRPQMVNQVFYRVYAGYITRPNFAEVAQRSLAALKVLTSTPSLTESFSGLKSKESRDTFVRRVEAMERRIERLDDPRDFTSRDLVSLFEDVQAANRQTVNLPDKVVVFEFVENGLAALDPFTSVIWPQDVREFQEQTDGSFFGVGIQIQLNEDKRLEVVSPIPDTPAYKAGIHAGDIIVRVRNEEGEHDIEELPPTATRLSRAVKWIKGEKGSPVTLIIYRPELDKELEIEIVRDKIEIESVKGYQRGENNDWDYFIDDAEKIAYVQVTGFNGNTIDTLKAELTKLKKQGMKGLILDLRNNPGGLLQAAEEMADMFLADGTVVSTKGRAITREYRYPAKPGDAFEDLPLIVLINEFSASASEIVSGAVRDTERGLVIGNRSFGKGSVQNLIPLDNRGLALIKLTTAKYYLPNGGEIHRDEDDDEWGVQPDWTLKLSSEEFRQVDRMQRKLHLLKYHEDGTAVQDVTTTRPVDGEAEDGDAAPTTQPADDEPELLQLTVDPQIHYALLAMRIKLLTGTEWVFNRTDESQQARK